MSEKLFTEFPPVSTEQWEAVIEKDLKGADYHKKLVWKTDDGLSIRPYYREENLNDIKHLYSEPGCFPFVRGTKADNHWLVRQGYCANESYSEANKQALDGITKGVESVGFCVDGSKECCVTDMEVLLAGIDLEKIEVNFEGCRCATALSYINRFTEYLQKQNVNPQLLRASFDFDPLRRLTTKGAFCHPDS
ncbi:MAG: methylmalonyl-CoA mutase family protein, partial [Prevotellaceae bacterium]|nr:methylmalonyl-CoA mutase family protein [Prevotellaceae bacterium]